MKLLWMKLTIIPFSLVGRGEVDGAALDRVAGLLSPPAPSSGRCRRVLCDFR